MVIDTLTIVLSVVLLLLAIVSCMMNPLFRMPKGDLALRSVDGESLSEDSEHDSAEKKTLPPLSIIILVNDNVDILEHNISLFLAQEYEPGYQIIIVAHEGDSQADDLIKRYKDDAHIQSTFIPKSSFYISREKLGVTLGIKAATNEWCILTDATCYPESNLWLAEIGKHCTAERNIVIGYCNYDNDAKSFQLFARLRRFAYIWREAVSSIPYSANYSNLAVRKSEFIKEDGYRGNLECIRGEYDFIINKYARKDKTGVVTTSEGTLTEVAPTDKQWHNRRKFYVHSCKLMSHGGLRNTLSIFDSLLLHLTWISCLALGVIAAIFQNWIVLGAAVLALLINIVWRTFIGKNAAEELHTEISTGAIVWLELTSIWHTLADKLRYKHSDKYDFTCHKL